MTGNGDLRLSVLVVQQEQEERERMQTLLTEQGMEVWTAPDGRAGLNAIRIFLPDVLVTDIALKGVDGFSLISEGREIVPDLKTVVVFGPCNPDELVLAVEMGVKALLPLPADEDRLLEAVEECGREIATARRAAQADYSLHQLLDFFPGPAVLVNGLDVEYMNRPLTTYLGYEDHGLLAELDMGLEDFIVRLNDEEYGGSPKEWIESMVNDPLDRDHVMHIENPRHPGGKPNAFGVTFRQFSGSDMRLFIFQDVSGFEDERARLTDEASTDPLTRALNRRSFLFELGLTVSAGGPFGVIMFDIDHFKRVNDTYGHDVGDAVLREIAQLVRDNVRENDVLARWGGEEFLVLSPGADLERTAAMAERLRRSVAGYAFSGVPGQVTSSFGVVAHASGETADDLVKRADQALYQAKESGRNRVVVDS